MVHYVSNDQSQVLEAMLIQIFVRDLDKRIFTTMCLHMQEGR